MFTIETWIKVTEDQTLKTAVLHITAHMVGVSYYNSVSQHTADDAAERTTDTVDMLPAIHAKLTASGYTILDTLTRN